MQKILVHTLLRKRKVKTDIVVFIKPIKHVIRTISIMFSAITLPICLVLVVWFVTNCEAKKVPWVPASASEALLKGPQPAGLEGDGTTHTFLCRAFATYTMIPGRLVIENGTALCKNSFNGGEINHSEFEVLDIPNGASSWLPVIREIPSNAIVGGQQWTGEDSYICRTWAGNELIVGAYSNHEDSLWGCFYGLNGKEESSQNNMEILILNAYGSALGLTVS